MIPITLDEIEELSRKNAEGNYDPSLDGLERVLKAARLAHYYKAQLEAREARSWQHMVLAFCEV